MEKTKSENAIDQINFTESSPNGIKRVNSPLDENVISSLRAGELIYLSGVIYTARDAAHRRMTEYIAAGTPLPFDINGQTVYYAGPTPAGPCRVIGSAGPTTSGRMDAYAPQLMERGLKVMIGKGSRSREVAEAIKRQGGLYLIAVGGAGAIISQCVKSAEMCAFEDLGTEAVRRLRVEDMPLVVGIDCCGNDYYEMVQL